MGWRDWPYWLKGGIIGLVIFSIISILSFAYVLLSCNKNNFGCAIGLSYILFFSTIGTIICTLFGWIYGMIKGEKGRFYWLKGGIFGFILGFIFQMIISYYPPIYRIADNMGFLEISPFVFWTFVVLGIIIGWIYGKMKSRGEK